MVCIAAFIILILVGVFVAVASIFKKSIGARYLQTLKKSFGCVGKKIRLQKCETNFKDDVKNTFLKKVVLKHPRWVRPISVALEVLSVGLVLITVWSLVEGAKAGLALWTFGTCNVTQPSSCTLGSEMCGIDNVADPQNPLEAIGLWFSEWGQIFEAIPDRFHDWRATDYAVEPYIIAGSGVAAADKPYALEIFDPGCSVCQQSYRNMLANGFFDEYNVILMVYPIRGETSTKFKNSDLIARYIYAAEVAGTGVGYQIVNRLFTESNAEGINNQAYLTEQLDASAAEQELENWLQAFGVSDVKIDAIRNLANSTQVTNIINQVRDTVENKIKAKGIPTLIYDGRLTNGLFKDNNWLGATQ